MIALHYGIMFEDINHSGDGGLYAELIQNRAFQGANSTEPYVAVGGATLSLDRANPLSSALPTSIHVASPGNGTVGFTNPGWWGIAVSPQTYTGSFWVYGAYTGNFIASLISDTTDDVWATTNVTSTTVADSWTQLNYTLVPVEAATSSNNSLRITFDGSAVDSLNFNLISLFPPTYNNRPNGLRADLMEALAGLKPSFLRFAGGNNIEGYDPETLPRWIWNNTVGPLENRPGRLGDWGYWNTDGLGLVEYLYWCIDLDMEPILAVWSGFYLGGTVVSQEDLGPYIDEAMDMIDFVKGDSSTAGGALRVTLGYGAAPLYDIKYVEVGNEDNLNGGEESYVTYRYQAFYDAITAKYPDIMVIASTTAIALPEPASTAAGADYHEYTRPDHFVSQFNYFDVNTSSHLTFIGEYATVQPNDPRQVGVDWNAPRMPFPFWVGTVAEAVFLLGAERNSGAMLGAAYAPTFQNLNSYEWAPDLISFTADPSQDILSTSYQMIKLFSNTRIAKTLPVTTESNFGPAYWVAGTGDSAYTSASYLLKTAIYNATSDVRFGVTFPDVVSGTAANLTVLTAPNPYSMVELGSGDIVTWNSTSITAGDDGSFSFGLPNYSIAILAVE